MYYPIHLFLISTLLILGIYELFQLTKLGIFVANVMRFTMKWFYNMVFAKKLKKNVYKYQHN